MTFDRFVEDAKLFEERLAFTEADQRQKPGAESSKALMPGARHPLPIVKGCGVCRPAGLLGGPDRDGKGCWSRLEGSDYEPYTGADPGDEKHGDEGVAHGLLPAVAGRSRRAENRSGISTWE